jgi:hypothetical protein
MTSTYRGCQDSAYKRAEILSLFCLSGWPCCLGLTGGGKSILWFILGKRSSGALSTTINVFDIGV